ncbi:hypothetical protein V6N11_041689 [Hibiscus sabdariffa]|uniref:Uncharacterized protein n=1 Tax=Hibiscus sabdariffa TaxID=183260 RepID=A0ABR2RL68_9ROSI
MGGGKGRVRSKGGPSLADGTRLCCGGVCRWGPPLEGRGHVLDRCGMFEPRYFFLEPAATLASSGRAWGSHGGSCDTWML